MAGIGDRETLMEDWMPPAPSPRTLMSSFLNEEFSFGPFSDLLGENGGSKAQDGSKKNKAFVDLSEEEPAQATKAPPFGKDLSLEPNLFGATHKCNSHGGLAERMAARAGFSVPKIDTSRVGSSTAIRSPVTIPPGLSPTTLLESPVFLSNALAQPSPTTGKLPFVLSSDSNPTILSIPEKAKDQLFDDEAFSFQPLLGSKPPSFSTAEKDFSAFYQNQSAANINQQEFNLQSSFTTGKDVTDETIVKPKTSDSLLGNDHPSPADEQEDGETDLKGEHSSAAIGAPAEDGYNWRKYGQKQVKNSEYPRSYYKCTHPNCPVKKKVERSHEGHITEIIYKGIHNHPKPPPNRRSGVPFSHPFDDPLVDGSENPGSQPGFNPASLWGSGQNGCLQDMQSEGLETKPSASITAAEFGDASILESQDAIDVSSTPSNEEDDRATHGTISLDCDGEEDETESKRRKLDASTTIDIGAAASRAVREPRVVVQTTSEVDILDDGYRWRKYGQKVVKGNPNPRSYYKCTNPGCSVRKHVERASHDLKSVITTYEGKHNHEVPAARNSGHQSSASGGVPPAAPQAHSLHRRPEPAQDSFARFGGAAPFGSFGLPPRDHLGPAGSFSFGMVPPGLTNLGMPALGPIAPPKMSGLPSTMQGYLGHHQARDTGLRMAKGELKEEPVSESGFPITNGAPSVYQQMMSRLPLGPQM